MKKHKFDVVALIGNEDKAARFAIVLANAGLSVCFIDSNKGDEGAAFDQALSRHAGLLYDPAFLGRIKTFSSWDGGCMVDWLAIFPEGEQMDPELSDRMLIAIEDNPGVSAGVFLDGSDAPVKSLPESLRRAACGLRFFEPLREPGLVEIMPSPETDGEYIEALTGFLARRLGRQAIICRGQGVAERILAFTVLYAAIAGLNNLLRPWEIDFFAGRALGGSVGPFKTIDRIGGAIFHDTVKRLFERSALALEKNAFIFYDLLFQPPEGYYREDGRVFHPVKGRYRKRKRIRFKKASAAVRKPMRERLPLLLEGYAAVHQFYGEFLGGLFHYAALLVENRLCRPVDIDEVLKEGAGWEMGLFEIWDAIGIRRGMTMMKAYDLQPPKWISGVYQEEKSFYAHEEGTARAYDPETSTYSIAHRGGEEPRRTAISESENAAIFDLGEGIFNVELRGYRNIIEAQSAAAIHRALDLAGQKNGGLIVSAQGTDFTVGVNLGLVFAAAIEKNYKELAYLVSEFQKLNMRLKYSEVSVTILPKGLTIGGGCEMTLHAHDALCLPVSYIGLPEAKAGLLPAGGGTKEMALRLAAMDANAGEYIAVLVNLATGKVSTSAFEAVNMRILRSPHQIIFDKRRQLAQAYSTIVETGKHFRKKEFPRTEPRVSFLPEMEETVALKQERGDLRPFEADIALTIASILDAARTGRTDEQGLLDMEREAFLSLCGARETLKRLKRILTR